jgi:hypothetical protein
MARLRLRLLSLALLLGSFVSSVHAATFGESFRNFVLGPEAQAKPRTGSVAADELASQCLGCHEGRKSMNRGAGRGPGVGPAASSHPIGMHYDQLARRKPQEYRPATSLHPNIKLIDGKMSCVSCHALKSDRHDAAAATPVAFNQDAGCLATKALSMGPRDKELCLGCHIK